MCSRLRNHPESVTKFGHSSFIFLSSKSFAQHINRLCTHMYAMLPFPPTHTHTPGYSGDFSGHNECFSDSNLPCHPVSFIVEMRKIDISIPKYGACLCKVSAHFGIGQGGKMKLKWTLRSTFGRACSEPLCSIDRE